MAAGHASGHRPAGGHQRAARYAGGAASSPYAVRRRRCSRNRAWRPSTHLIRPTQFPDANTPFQSILALTGATTGELNSSASSLLLDGGCPIACGWLAQLFSTDTTDRDCNDLTAFLPTAAAGRGVCWISGQRDPLKPQLRFSSSDRGSSNLCDTDCHGLFRPQWLPTGCACAQAPNVLAGRYGYGETVAVCISILIRQSTAQPGMILDIRRYQNAKGTASVKD